jgi:hypothetical protein
MAEGTSPWKDEVDRVWNKRSRATQGAVAGLGEVWGAKPSVNEASFTGQTQEQFSADRHGWRKCGKRRSSFPPAFRAVARLVDYARYRRPPWMAEVRKTQEQFFRETLSMKGAHTCLN